MRANGMTPAGINWIFVLIAGGLILMFLVKIAAVQTSSAQLEVRHRFGKQLQTTFLGKAVESDTSSVITDLEGRRVSFVCRMPCNEQIGCDSFFQLWGDDQQIPMRTELIFSPTSLTARNLYAFTLGWQLPFHAGTFLYVGRPGRAIVFPQDCTSTLCRTTFDAIPESLKTAKIVVQESSTAKEQVHVRFSLPCALQGEATRCVNSTHVHFLPENKVFPYAGTPGLLGTLFTEHAETYECSLHKSMYQLQNVYATLEAKRQILAQALSFNTNCVTHLQSMEQPLNAFNVTHFDNLTALTTAGQELQTAHLALRRNSCSGLY